MMSAGRVMATASVAIETCSSDWMASTAASIAAGSISG